MASKERAGEGAETGVTELLRRWSEGDQAAAEELLPRVYRELRLLARNAMRNEAVGHTLQPTALIHEAYLRLVASRQPAWHSRVHFFAVAAQVMRRVLVDHARRRDALKRGRGAVTVALGSDVAEQLATEGDAVDTVDLLTLNEAIERLDRIDPRQRKIVDLRFFGGLSLDEVAQLLEMSVPSVVREQRAAKAWLYKEMLA